MKIKRSQLEQMVREELSNYLKEMLEADGDKKVGIEDGDKSSKEKEKKSDKKGPPEPDNMADKPKSGGKTPPMQTEPAADTPKPKKGPGRPPKDDQPEELPAVDQPEDQTLDQDVADAGDPGEEDAPDEKKPGKSLGDEMVGKTIQSLTMEPKSKLMPGAIEIVVTFNDTPDPLRILVPKTGTPKFYFRGLHNDV